jgi:hypothetical protein
MVYLIYFINFFIKLDKIHNLLLHNLLLHNLLLYNLLLHNLLFYAYSKKYF